MDIDILQREAMQHLQAGELDKASAICRKIINKKPRDVFSLHMLGRLAYGQDKFEDAVRYLKRAHDAQPVNSDILLEYGAALRLTKQYEEAINYLRQALSLKKTQITLVELGLSLAENRDFDESKKILQEALIIKPTCVNSLKQLAYIAVIENDLDKAISYCEKVVKLNPNNINAYPEIIKAHLRNSNPEKALEYCNKCFELEPACTGVLAFQYIALSELGDIEALHYLFDTKQYLKIIKGKSPANLLNINDFNKQLSDHILNKAPKTKTPERYTTINGWQTQNGELFATNKKLGSLMLKMINNALDEYLSLISDDARHPVNKGKPSETLIKAWAVVLNTEGHQGPHVHPEAWISGVYYIDLPEDFDSQSDPQGGHITFGQGERPLHPIRNPQTITIKPEEGVFVLFPSYFWHHTIPLQSSKNRICIAFDVVPTKGWGK